MTHGIDFVGVAVVFYCHDGKGNVVLNKRSGKTRDEHGRWDIGGGKLEFGVPVEKNLRNEVREEYGTEILSYEFLGYRDVHRTGEGKPSHWIALDYKVLIDPAHVRNAEPHKFDEVRWFPAGSLPSPLHSQLPVFLKNYREKLPH